MIAVITNVFAFTHSITIVNTFGNRLRFARNLRQLTQQELARLCGLSQGAIGNYETDSRRSPKDVFRIAEALNVEAAWLAMGTGPMEPAAPPRIADTPLQSASWPFPGVDPDRIWALSADQREMLESTLAAMIAMFEKRTTKNRV